jgi:outer membrane receptor protein involved in Fe transport
VRLSIVSTRRFLLVSPLASPLTAQGVRPDSTRRDTVSARLGYSGERQHGTTELRSLNGHPARLRPFLTVNNLFDHQYVSSVVINAANGRCDRPAPGANASARFRDDR